MDIRYKTSSAVQNICAVALNVSLITLCSWIAIPFVISFTMQTFAIFTIALLFRPKIVIPSICVYILLGAIGLPVFAGFNAGAGVILGPTGGYILSFIPCSAVVSAFSYKMNNNFKFNLFIMFFAMIICYFIGTLWYVVVYCGKHEGALPSAKAVLCYCVLPFVIPDIIKFVLSAFIAKRLLPIKQRIFENL